MTLSDALNDGDVPLDRTHHTDETLFYDVRFDGRTSQTEAGVHDGGGEPR